MVTSGNWVGSTRDLDHSLVHDSFIQFTNICFSSDLDTMLNTWNTAVNKAGKFLPSPCVIYIRGFR